LLLFLLSCGCGNPEAPQITNVRLSYWDSLTGGAWVSLEDGGVAPQSPVRIQGNITDNTAVVNPRIVWTAVREDAGGQGFSSCSGAEDGFFECQMSCEAAEGGFFECEPSLAARRLIRGDRFLFSLGTADGEENQVEVRVSEAQDILVPASEEDPIRIRAEYRILRVTSLEGDPGLVYSLYYRTACSTSGRPAQDCPAGGASPGCYTLRSGDAFSWDPEEAEPCSFQILLRAGDGEDGIDSVTALWRSLVKWNDDDFLDWDATSGNFTEVFQVFDPRLRSEGSGEVIGGQEPALYRYSVSAEDVPDQKTGVFRSTQVARQFSFSPDRLDWQPELEVTGEDEDRVETSNAAENITGSIKSFSGEVRSLLLRLSEGEQGGRSRFLLLDPETITLEGDFLAALVFLTDWDGDGIVDEPDEAGGLPNSLSVLALDVQGNQTEKNVPIVFLPSTKENQAPQIQIREIFPAVDKNQNAQLPFGETLRVRARAADDRGQPSFSAYRCACPAEEPPINDVRCPCDPLTGGKGTPERADDWVDLNAGGEYPQNPWEWIEVEPASVTYKTIGVLLAKEKVEDEEEIPTARFSGFEIDVDPDSEQEAYEIAVSLQETTGPNVILSNLKNGQIVTPEDLLLQATIYANVSELNEIKALWNGKPRGEPTFDAATGSFAWDLRGETLREGDRLCVGAVSVTGHATLNLLEFASSSGGLLLGVTVTSDAQACDQAS
jgi:hypothetical protein